MSFTPPPSPDPADFPAGTTFEHVPPTCIAPDAYVTPACSHDSYIIRIPMDITIDGLALTGTDLTWLFWGIAGASVLLILVGVWGVVAGAEKVRRQGRR